MDTGWWLVLCFAVLAIGFFLGNFVRSYKIGETMTIAGDLHVLDDDTIYLAANKEQLKYLKDKAFVIFQVYHDNEEKIAEKTRSITE